MRFAVLAALPFLLAACAQDSPNPVAGAPVPAAGASQVQVAQQICHREQPIGSNIPVTRCGPANTGDLSQQMDRGQLSRPTTPNAKNN